ncbi:DNA-binding response regulator, NarL/FixJ family, contains REC and HTH domains [Ferrimonas sediminum]|uniref:DNA-binding response regulator, NarL/FixJ family, contains REC and HTH domains n=1 Tax=Ferrimonas sediminum TaxID=718193 RepID=A0A1G8NGB1_9GAMM|nr:response regulator transcription factor [Ferrimonas sediminum]SDI79116.1 DNA-binding response regulator, NarL/FixJ family, contains REC and HTH domains [Ferrimonas sediminum]
MDQPDRSIIIADDHPLFRQALKQSLSLFMADTRWLEAESADTLEHCLNHHPGIDLILLDLQMPGSHGYSTLIHLRSHHPAIPVMVISAHEDSQTVAKAMQYGAQGFIPKSAQPQQLAEALQRVLEGDIYLPQGMENLNEAQSSDDDIGARLAELTPQQYRVLQMFAEGLLNKQIAYELEVSEATIKAHATAIFKKLGVRNRTQAVIALQGLDMDSRPV